MGIRMSHDCTRSRAALSDEEERRSFLSLLNSGEVISVHLTPGEIWSLLTQYKDGDLGSADRKLEEALKAATGRGLFDKSEAG